MTETSYTELNTLEEIKNSKGKIIAVDFGDVRTGLAVSDVSRLLASGIGNISVGGIEKEYGRYCGNYESVLKLWEQYVDNIYNTLLDLKTDKNLPRTVLEIPSLKAIVDSM